MLTSKLMRMDSPYQTIMETASCVAEQAYGFGLTEYLNAELDEDLKEEFSAGIISKLTKRDYIDEGSININMTITSLNTWQTHIQFKENDGTDFLIDVGTDGKEIYVT